MYACVCMCVSIDLSIYASMYVCMCVCMYALACMSARIQTPTMPIAKVSCMKLLRPSDLKTLRP